MHDWNQLRTALAVIEAGSIGGAAARLRVSPATVSRHLQALEGVLGRPVLDRTPGRVGITPFGRQIAPSLQAAERALADVGRLAEAEVAPAGTVRLATMALLATEYIVPAIPAFRASHPGIQLELLLHHAVVNLGRGDADIALRGVRPTQENLVCKRVDTTRLGAYAAPSLLARHPDPATVPFVGWPASTGVHEARWLGQLVPGARVVLRVDDPHTHAAACRAGIGAGLMTGDAAAGYGLVAVPGVPLGPEVALWLAMPEALRGVPRVDAVWSWLSDGFAARAASR